MYKLFFKRLIDVTAALLTLFLIFPIILITALIIKLQDGGPAFFIQERVGEKACLFKMYKFRSMPVHTANVESREISKITITRFGKFIRRSNLDELPQLFNIIKGDMSLIGYRPCLPTQESLVQMRKENGVYICKPGLTGLAQVNAYDGMPPKVKAEYDAKYVADITFLNDLIIVFKTLNYLTKKPPVY